MERQERRQNHIEFLLGNCPYFYNMVEIGKIVSKFGEPPKQFPANSIHTLEAGMYRADVFLTSANCSTVAISKKDPNKKVLSPFECSDMNLEVHSNGRMEALINVFTESEAVKFQRPTGKGIEFTDLMFYLQIKAAANRVCPNTFRYLNGITNDALSVYRSFYPVTSLNNETKSWPLL